MSYLFVVVEFLQESLIEGDLNGFHVYILCGLSIHSQIIKEDDHKLLDFSSQASLTNCG